MSSGQQEWTELILFLGGVGIGFFSKNGEAISVENFHFSYERQYFYYPRYGLEGVMKIKSYFATHGRF